MEINFVVFFLHMFFWVCLLVDLFFDSFRIKEFIPDAHQEERNLVQLLIQVQDTMMSQEVEKGQSLQVSTQWKFRI